MEDGNVIIREAKKMICKKKVQNRLKYNSLQALAKYEELEDQCQITPEVLIQDGFDTNAPAFKCFVAVADGAIVGYAVYFISYSTWLGKSTFLEDLYVNPEFRNRGVGKKLFTAVAKQAQANQSKRLDLHCLSWNNAMNFYKNIGAKNLTECEKWNYLRIDGEDLNKL